MMYSRALWGIVAVLGAISCHADQYAILFDCGSSGTRARIYHNLETKLAEFIPPEDADAEKLEIKPGISSYVGDKDGFDQMWAGLLTEVKRWVPKSEVGSAAVMAHATAGMRMLSDADQATIWSWAKASTHAAGFQGGMYSTISGNYEGLFAWLATNYILDNLPLKESKLGQGTLDLGGASTQITFKPKSNAITEGALRFDSEMGLGMAQVRLYSHSYMLVGQDQAQNRLAQYIAKKEYIDKGQSIPDTIPSPCYYSGLTKDFTVCTDPAAKTGNAHNNTACPGTLPTSDDHTVY